MKFLATSYHICPPKTAVSTCVLSTRWRNLFPFCCSLDLDGSSVNFRDSSRFMDNVDSCIMLKNGTHIDTFRLKCGPYIDTCRFESWMCSAIQSNVRELDLCINLHQLSIVDSPFFLCTTLVVLKLATSSYPLVVPAFVHLPCLKIIHLDSNMFSYDRAPPIQRLVSGCPVLEEFSIVGRNYIKGVIELRLSSSSLKRLAIAEGLIYKLVLDAPSLLYLNLFVLTGSCYTLENIHSLSVVHVRLSHSLEPAALPQLFEGIGNVQSLYLSSYLGKNLLSMFGEPLLLKNLTCLRLIDLLYLDVSVVMKFLQWCPNLEEFSFYGRIFGEYEYRCVDVPSCVPSRLKIVKCCLGCILESIERDVALLEYFLNNAKVLEKMQIQILCPGMGFQRGIEIWETTMETLRKCANSPGRSKTCTLKFIFTDFWERGRNTFVIEK